MATKSIVVSAETLKYLKNLPISDLMSFDEPNVD